MEDMQRGDPENIIEETKRQITGTKTPSDKRLFYTIIIIAVFFIVSNIVSFYIGRGLVTLHKEANVEIYIDPYLKTTGNKSYLPLQISNIGDMPITNGIVHISTCKMSNDDGSKYYENYPVPLVPESESFEVKFANKKTIESFSRKDCSPDVPNVERGISFKINPYSNEVQEIVRTGCGICYYDVIFQSDQIDKKFLDYFFSAPVDVEISFIPERAFNNS